MSIEQLPFIDPQRLYDTPTVAAFIGLSTGSLRKVTAGIRTSPLVPRVTRLGPKSVRFLGRDILAWLEDPVGASEQSRAALQAQQKTAAVLALGAAPAKRRVGRPSNRERDAEHMVRGAV